MHIPVATHPDGQKLSKLTGAPGVPLKDTEATLLAALKGLGQQPPASLASCRLEEIWAWAVGHWDIAVMAGKTQFVADDNALAGGENGLL